MIDNHPQHWMITGASGLLGHALCEHLATVGKTVSALKSTNDVGIEGVREFAVDVTDKGEIQRIITELKPDVIVHTAGLTNVDECEKNPALAEAVHVEGTRYIAEAAQILNISMVYISTDHLWDGTQSMVDEKTPTKPINVYARTKHDGELVALDICKQALSIRTNFFGPGRPWRPSFSDWILKNLAQGVPLNMFTDAYFTPISTHYLSRAIIELVADKANGIFNVVGSERLSKYEFAILLAEAANYSSHTINKVLLSDFGLAAPRPLDMSLSTEKIITFLKHTMPTAKECINSLNLSVSTPERTKVR